MQITDAQARQLRITMNFRSAPPTVRWYFTSSWRIYLYLILLGVVAYPFFWWGGWPLVSGFFAGMVVAMLLRDLRWYQAFVAAWPLNKEITDWTRVQALLNERSTPP